MKSMQMSRLRAGPVNLRAGPVNLYCYTLRQFEVRANIKTKNTPIMPPECPLFNTVARPTEAEFLEGYFIPSIYLCLALELVTGTYSYVCAYMNIYIYIYTHTQIEQGKGEKLSVSVSLATE
jgi:hypothetical protein